MWPAYFLALYANEREREVKVWRLCATRKERMGDARLRKSEAKRRAWEPNRHALACVW
jgi:hypothetical protein